jgi:hypothetical protein
MAQREFMMKALESDDDLTPTKVMKYWEQRKALEVSPQKLPTQETYYDKLKDDEDKMEALNDAYYRELKGSVGARAFYEWFKRNNAKQRKSIEDKGKETGKRRKVPEQFRKDMEERRRKREADGTARRDIDPIPEYYTEKVKPWISWREARAYVAAQESNQLMLPANPKTSSMATGFRKSMLVPLVRFQLDVIDMSKTADRSKSFADHGYTKVLNMIDIYSGYTWQMAAKKDTGKNAVEFVERVLGAIEERWDRENVQSSIEIKTDNGASFSDAEFQEPLQALQNWQITFKRANANTPNQMAFIENANREWRNIARRVLEVKSEDLTDAQIRSKPIGARWHGGPGNQAMGAQLREINSLMNKRANTTRANESPSRILEAALEPGQGVDEAGEPRTEEQDKELIERVNASLLKTQAARRRGAVQLKPYKVDDTVRLINAKYLKASTRSNAMKMGPRWSRTIYEITKVRGTTGVPEYRVQPLEDDNGNPIVADGDEHKPSQWYPHDRIQKITAADAPVSDKVRDQATYKIDKDIGGKRYYQDYPFAEER